MPVGRLTSLNVIFVSLTQFERANTLADDPLLNWSGQLMAILQLVLSPILITLSVLAIRASSSASSPQETQQSAPN